MANPPYSGFVLIVEENVDGFFAQAFLYADFPEGSTFPKGAVGIRESLLSGINTSKTPPDQYLSRNAATRTALKNAFAQFVDAKFTDSPA